MDLVFLLLGSNLGNRQLFLQQAIEKIIEEISPVIKSSALYETQSWGKTDEPDYLNQVITLLTDLSPQTILQKILSIELDLGRKRDGKWGARVIDIDILFYGTAIIHEPGLTIPHPHLHNRRFTMEPLAEIAPEFIHPVLNQSIINIKNMLEDCLVVKKL